MKEQDDDKLEVPPHQLMRIVITAIFVFVVIGGIYFLNFNDGFGDRESFGLFGDYLGGTLNPILGFLTIVLLIWSINIQLHEFRLTRKEMEKSRVELERTAKAQSESYQLQLSEVSHRQLDDALSKLYSEYEAIWHVKAFNNFFNMDKVSLFEIFEGRLTTDDSIVKAIKLTANVVGKGQHPGSVGIPEAVVMFESIISISDTINKITIDIIHSTDNSSLREYYEHNAKKINYKLNKFGLYDDEKFNLLNAKLTVATRASN